MAVGIFDMLGVGGLTVDEPVRAAVVGQGGTPVAEDLGIDVIEGARARHCQTVTDGPTALRASLPLRWLAESDLTAIPHPLVAWRGTLDWWVFGDGQLGQAVIAIGGYPGEAWPSGGIQGSITARLTATNRGDDIQVRPPATPGATP